jgi:cytochrome c553
MRKFRPAAAPLVLLWLGLCQPAAALAAESDATLLLERLLKLRSDPASLELLQAEGRRQAATCARCHGENGISERELVSNLAGQNPDYLLRQMDALAGARRRHLAMVSALDGFSPADRELVALYYASMAVPPRSADAGASARGARLYEQRCLSCHGSDAYGTASVPRLAGQRTDYMRWTLANIQRGKPRPLPVMENACANLSKGDIADLAEYLSALP